jgi:hypothetical protein
MIKRLVDKILDNETGELYSDHDLLDNSVINLAAIRLKCALVGTAYFNPGGEILAAERAGLRFAAR